MMSSIQPVVSTTAPQGGGLSGVAAPSPPTVTAQAVSESAPDAGPQRLDEALDVFSVAANDAGAALDFRIDDDTGRLVVSVIDRSSGDVLRQIPSEEALRIAHHLQQTQDRGGALIAAMA